MRYDNLFLANLEDIGAKVVFLKTIQSWLFETLKYWILNKQYETINNVMYLTL